MPATERIGDRGIGWLLVVATAAGWGIGWPMMKIVIHDWPPLFARGSAGVVAAIGLVCLATLRGERLLPARAHLGWLLFSAAVNVFFWMGFTAVSLRWLNVAEAALLTFTMPIWAALLAWPLVGERPTIYTVVAIGLCVVGLALPVVSDADGAGAELPGVGFALTASVLFALGTVLARRRRSAVLPPIAWAAWLVGLGSLTMIVVGYASEQPDLSALTLVSAGALLYLAIVPMGLCYLMWFGAVTRIPSATASIGLLLVPVVGAVSAAVILGEPLGGLQILALGLTLTGVAVEMRASAR